MAKNNVPSLWGDPKNQKLLERLAAKKLYAADIAERLGTTKNSIIGRAYRTGVALSQPDKMLRMRRETAKIMVKWNKDPANAAFRHERIREAWRLKRLDGLSQDN